MAAATTLIGTPLSARPVARGGPTWPAVRCVIPLGSGNILGPDSTLVARCLSGDDAAWEDMVKTHTRRVYAMCYRFTGKDSEAQDLTQEVFLRVFRTLRTFRSGEASSWSG